MKRGTGDPDLAAVSPRGLTAGRQLLRGARHAVPYQDFVDQIGPQSGASRAYVFVNHLDDGGRVLTSQVAEWCAPGVDPQIGNPELQSFPLEAALPRWLRTLADGVAISSPLSRLPADEQAVLAAQGIRAILVLPLMVDHSLYGFIGFDNCTSDRQWQPEEEEFLAAAAGQLADTIARIDAEAGIRASHDQLLTILDGLPSAVYVSDMDSHEILFVNNHTRGLFGECVGRTCWQTFHEGMEGPCDFCTNPKLVDARGQSTGPLEWEFHNRRLGRWFQIVDQAVRWVDGHLVRLEIATDITEGKLDRDRLAARVDLDEQRLESLLALSQMHGLDEAELVGHALEEAVRLTGSQVGYLHLVDEKTRSVTLHTWSRSVTARCAVPDPGSYPIAEAGVWADCVRRREPVIHNDYPALADARGMPEGHVPIHRHLAVPVFNGDTIVAVAGVGNKEQPYDDGDVRQLRLFMGSLWGILLRQRTEEELRRANELLEERVRRRTTELERATRALSQVAAGVSASVGREFFDSLVLHIAAALEADFALVARLAGEEGSHAETLAVAAAGDITDNFTYELRGTPYEVVAKTGLCLYPEGVQERFPDDPMLVEMGLHSFAGIPLHGSGGAVLGLVAVLDSRPMGTRSEQVSSVLQVFATRAAAELERRVAEEALRSSEERYRSITESIPIGMLIYRLEERGRLVFLGANPAADRILGVDCRRFVDLTIEEAFPDLADTEIPERYREVARSGVPWHTDLVHYTEGEIAGTYVVDAFRISANTIVVAFDDITDKHRAEETILEQNRFLNTVIESLTHPFYVIDVADYSIRLANTAAFVDDLPVGVTCYALTHRRDEPCNSREHPCPLEVVKATGKAVVVEHVHVDAQGEARNVEIHGYPVLDGDGRVVQIIEYAMDVTERRRAEERVRQRNRELILLNWVMAAAASDMEPEAVLETACRELALGLGLPMAVASLVDPAHTGVSAVAEFTAPGHATLGEIAPACAHDPVISFMREHKVPLVSTNVDTDQRLENARDLLRSRGTVSLLAAPLIVEGEVVGAICLQATSPRRFSDEEVSLAMTVAGQVAGSLARSQLAQTRRRLETAIEQTDDAVLISDPRGRIVYVNPAFERVSGLSGDQAMGDATEVLRQLGVDPASLEEMRAVVRHGTVWRGRLMLRSASGSALIEDAVVTPVRDAVGNIVNMVAVARDVTRHVQLEEQYRQSQKLESIGRLAGGVAHDFNNLLAAIIGYTELALTALDEDHPLFEDLTEIRDTSGRAAELASQLLAFARRQVMEPKALDLNGLIANLEKMLRRLIGEHIVLETAADEELDLVMADHGLIEQVIVNLVVNARDAMPEGGSLTLQTRNLEVRLTDDPPMAEVRPGAYVQLTVSDTGVGMPEEILDHLFEPFFTTKEVGQGTGLGLATCFGIVTQAKGHIWAESRVGEGSRIHVLLPRAPDAGAGDQPARRGISDLPAGDETILLVEDDAAVRNVVRRVLGDCGYRVLTAADGSEGLAVAQDNLDHIDLLLTDVVMPGVGGVDLAGLLRAREPDLKVLLISGYTGDSKVDTGATDSGLRFLGKPFTPAALAETVRELLDR